jgi:hypothetical protein
MPGVKIVEPFLVRALGCEGSPPLEDKYPFDEILS